MLKINQIKLPLTADEHDLRRAAGKALRLDENRIRTLRVTKKAVDSRKKDNIFFVYNVEVDVDGDENAILKRCGSGVETVKKVDFIPPEVKRTSELRPVIVGFGPAGMFSGLALARAGFKPLILERGSHIEDRQKDVQTFWRERRLNPESNVQFGEGGAGTFSDGKLTTGIKDPLCRFVIDELANHGAPEEIRWSAKPHIGTDRLAEVVRNIRKEIISLGGEIRFNCKMTDIIVANGYIHGVKTEHDGHFEDIETDTVLLCTGHSARDTVRTLYAHGVKMMQKPFSVGARIEHPREFIDRAQYGDFAGHPALGAADYKLACHPEHGRGAYTFCMCPGGTVVNAASEEGGIVVNGMSEHARDQANANSALLVQVTPADYGSGPFDGMRFQEELEHRAFVMGGSSYCAPAQQVRDFLARRPSLEIGEVAPSYARGVTLCDLHDLFPAAISTALEEGLQHFEHQLPGFSTCGILSAVESRSSSPLRMCRDETLTSSIEGIMPLGEGAGYAGGIVTSAVDGVRGAMSLMQRFAPAEA